MLKKMLSLVVSVYYRSLGASIVGKEMMLWESSCIILGSLDPESLTG